MIHRSRQGVVNVIRCDGPLNGESAEELVASVNDCLGEGQPRIVLDLQHVALIDSVGLESLLDVRDLLESHAGVVKLAGANPLCRDILGATGVGYSFEMFEEVKPALGSFAQ